MSKCCICGSPLLDDEQVFLLTQRYPGETVCPSCHAMLQHLQASAANGSAAYPSEIDVLTAVAEDSSTPLARDFLRDFLLEANKTWEQATPKSAPQGQTPPSAGSFAGSGDAVQATRDPAVVYCSVCGAKNAAGDRFCRECGSSTNRSTQQKRRNRDKGQRSRPSAASVFDGREDEAEDPVPATLTLRSQRRRQAPQRDRDNSQKNASLDDFVDGMIAKPASNGRKPSDPARPAGPVRETCAASSGTEAYADDGELRGLNADAAKKRPGAGLSMDACCLCGELLIDENSRYPLSKKHPQYRVCPECKGKLDAFRRSAEEGSARYPRDRQAVAALCKNDLAADPAAADILRGIIASLDEKHGGLSHRRSSQLIVIICVAVLSLALIGAMTVLLIPLFRYKRAMKLFENAEYKEAAAAFTDLGTYKDSDDMVKESWYALALKCYKSEDYDRALYYFEKTKGYRDSEDWIQRLDYLSGVSPVLEEVPADPPEQTAMPQVSPMPSDYRPAPAATALPEEQKTPVPEDSSAVTIPADVTYLPQKKAVCAAENSCNIRQSPSQNGKQIGTLKRGETVVVEGTYKSYFLIRIGSDQKGWISHKYLIATWMFKNVINTQLKGITAPSAEIKYVEVRTIVAKKANFRVGPDVSFAKKTSPIEKGRQVVVLCQEGDWLFCNYKGDFGWIALSNFVDEDS